MVYSKQEAANFNNNIANTNNFKSLKCKAKLLVVNYQLNTVAKPATNAANGILRNVTIVVPLRHLSNFWRSLEIALINCKVELKLIWTKHCVLPVARIDKANGNNDDNIIFTNKDTKLYVPVITLSARDNQTLSKLLRK